MAMTVRAKVLLANTQGQPLIAHLRLVGQVARQMAVRAGLHDDSFDLPGMVECAGYGHDIGKAVSWFQAYVGRQETEEQEQSLPLHHEISWACLVERFGVYKQNREILGAIYWHHSRPLDQDGNCITSQFEILRHIKDADHKAIETVVAGFDWSHGFRDDSGYDADEQVPNLFLPEGRGNIDSRTNARMFAVRTCVIAADRLVSSLSPELFSELADGRTTIDSILDRLTGALADRPVTVPHGYSSDRFVLQQECAAAAASARTVIVRAPAGFGKTMIGILWALKAGERLLWVCPRNVVAESVYRKIVEELDALGLDVTAELHLTGCRQAARGTSPDFASDIVVTNIDTILTPMVNNRTADRLFTVLSSAMVLDEFHEFATDQPLFAAFVTLMRARHRLCSKVRTLLLSATPMCMHQLWDTDGNKTVMLPGAMTHYPPAHAGRYRISIEAAIPATLAPGSLTVCNSIRLAQSIYREKALNVLVHSRFTDADRARITQGLFDDFGKTGHGVAEGKRAVSALVIQAAMDLSFQHLYEHVCSPESTLQRIGRCDRWGTFQQNGPTIILLAPGGQPNENGAVRAVYDTRLQSLWVTTLQAALQNQTDWGLADIYELYNRFYAEHGAAVLEFLSGNYSQGLERLQDYCPVKIKGPPDASAERTTGGRSLRNPFGSYFFSVRKSDGQWLGPDDVMDEGPPLRTRFDDHDNVTTLCNLAAMKRYVRGLVEAGFARYGRYVRGRRRLPDAPDKWFRLSRSWETPLPDFTREYDTEIGLHERR